MKLSAQRETILKPLQAVIGVVERRQTMPILANVLLVAKDGVLSITATDLEVELVAQTEVDLETAGEITLPGRKLFDICRALNDGVKLTLVVDGEKATIRAGRSRFTLASLPASDFPTVDEISEQQKLKLKRADLGRLLDKTHFAMAQQDVRYYLNGLLVETDGKILRAVATDGHRLALCTVELDKAAERNEQVIVPRKGVLELQRLLDDDGEVEVTLGSNHVRAELDGIRFTSKLIDGRFPEYGRVVPNNPTNVIKADREIFRHALQRAAILSNEKYRGIRMELAENAVTIQANNPEQEEAEETVEVEYQGDEIEVGFNVNYLLDALAAVDHDQVHLGLSDPNSSCLIHGPEGADDARFVVMPMRL